MESLSRAVFSVTGPLMTPQKSLWAGLCLNWRDIVGNVARVSRALKLHFFKGPGSGTLLVGVWDGQTFLVSHETEYIKDAVNRYAGKEVIVYVKYKEVSAPSRCKPSVKLLKESSAQGLPWARSIIEARKGVSAHGADPLESALLSFGGSLYKKECPA